MIYLDTCAVLKLARDEEHSDEFFGWLEQHASEPLVSSVLLEVEMARALRRCDPDALPRVPGILSNINLIELRPSIRATAAAFPDPLLRSLDALHLATAQYAESSTGLRLSAFATYDKRLIAAARAAGVRVEHPGARY